MGSGLFLLCAVRQPFRTSSLHSFISSSVILSTSEPTLAACAETACRLCHARRRSTSAAQLRICFTAPSLRGLSSPWQSEQNYQHPESSGHFVPCLFPQNTATLCVAICGGPHRRCVRPQPPQMNAQQRISAFFKIFSLGKCSFRLYLYFVLRISCHRTANSSKTLHPAPVEMNPSERGERVCTIG